MICAGVVLDRGHYIGQCRAMTHKFPLRVYYEDTDLAGIVYYANYLKFIERGRSEMLRDRGIDQGAIRQEDGVVFAVRRVEADYLKPALFDDELVVESAVKSVGGARIELTQNVMRDGAILFSSTVTIVALSTDGRPARLPAKVRLALGSSDN